MRQEKLSRRLLNVVDDLCAAPVSALCHHGDDATFEVTGPDHFVAPICVERLQDRVPSTRVA